VKQATKSKEKKCGVEVRNNKREKCEKESVRNVREREVNEFDPDFVEIQNMSDLS